MGASNSKIISGGSPPPAQTVVPVEPCIVEASYIALPHQLQHTDRRWSRVDIMKYLLTDGRYNLEILVPSGMQVAVLHSSKPSSRPGNFDCWWAPKPNNPHQQLIHFELGWDVNFRLCPMDGETQIPPLMEHAYEHAIKQIKLPVPPSTNHTMTGEIATAVATAVASALRSVAPVSADMLLTEAGYPPKTNVEIQGKGKGPMQKVQKSRASRQQATAATTSRANKTQQTQARAKSPSSGEDRAESSSSDDLFEMDEYLPTLASVSKDGYMPRKKAKIHHK